MTSTYSLVASLLPPTVPLIPSVAIRTWDTRQWERECSLLLASFKPSQGRTGSCVSMSSTGKADTAVATKVLSHKDTCSFPKWHCLQMRHSVNMCWTREWNEWNTGSPNCYGAPLVQWPKNWILSLIQVSRSRIKIQLCQLFAKWPWENYFTSLKLNFFILIKQG